MHCLGTCSEPALPPLNIADCLLLAPLGSLSCILQALRYIPLLPNLLYAGSTPLLGSSFPFEALWRASFGLLPACVPQLDLYIVLMDPNKLPFSLRRPLFFLLIHPKLTPAISSPLVCLQMGRYPQPNTSAGVKPGRLQVSPSPSAQKAHQHYMRVHSLTTVHLMQISNAVNNSFPINDT